PDICGAPTGNCAAPLTSVTKTVTIAVTVNNAPVLTVPGALSAEASQLLQFTISAFDPDGDALSFSASGLPAGAIFTAATQTLSWTPNFSQLGSYTLSFNVTDGYGGFDTKTVTVTVQDTTAPTWGNMPDQTIEVVGTAGTVVTYVVPTVSDADPQPSV